MDVMTLSARLTLDTGDFESGLRNAEGKMKKAGKSADSGVKGFSAKAVALGTFAGNVLTKVAEKAVSAVASIVSKSVEAFADYEQLVGGVSTLFGQRDIKNARDYAKQIGLVEEKVDRAGRTVTKVNKKMAKGLFGKDANKMTPDEMIERVYQEAGQAEQLVFENANQAYRTAGMSMNHYMEVATSFASSMVQSLKGDTLEAARLTDMAVRDMADNANKMGTDIGSIENAYKGFAKGNFTMLDNLKLGYGGTRKEMERLLKDAQAITGEKYDINNMGDVTRAIHVIQQQKGITGTTEREAEQTITGSKLMLQAAWENVLVALAAPDDLDLSGAISSLTESAKTYLNNIFPVVSQVVSGLGDFMEQILPDVMEKLPELIADFAPKLWNAVKGMVKGLGKGIVSAFKKIKWPTWDDVKTAAKNGWKKIVDGVGKLGGLIFGKDSEGKVQWPDITKLVSNFSTWWNETAVPALKGAMTWFLTLFGMPQETAEQISGVISEWWGSVVDAATSVLNWALNLPDSPHEAGEQLKAIIDKWWGSVKETAEGVLQWVLGLFGIGDSDGTQTLEMIGGWWDDYIKPFLQGVLDFALGLFGLPDSESMIEGLSSWWDKEVVPSLMSLINYVLGLFGLPDAETMVSSISTWWTESVVPTLKDTLAYILDVFGLPDATAMKTKIENWWNNDVLPLISNLLHINIGFGFGNGGNGPATPGQGVLSGEQQTGIMTKYGHMLLGKETRENFYSNIAQEMQKAQFSAEEIAAAQAEITAHEEDPQWIKSYLANLSSANTDTESLAEQIAGIEGEHEVKIKITTEGSLPNLGVGDEDDPGFAKGLPTVPYDNFIARLHRGEMVLTASQARKYREGQNSVDTAAFAASVVAAVREGMAGASVNSYLDGKGVTERVNRRTSNRMRARRFAPA